MRAFIFFLLILMMIIEEYKCYSIKKKAKKAIATLILTGGYSSCLKSWSNAVAYLENSLGKEVSDFLVQWANRNLEEIDRLPFIFCCVYIVIETENIKNHPYNIIYFYLKVRNVVSNKDFIDKLFN